MIKLNDILNEGGKLFGGISDRMTTQEMRDIFEYIKSKISKYFVETLLVKSLPTKEDHGDLDIIIQMPKDEKGISSIQDLLKRELGNDMLDFSKNANVNSILFRWKNKQVQVDFITAKDKNLFTSISQYYQFNDISGIIGIFSKKIHFSYGQGGFMKTYNDKRNNRHYIYITNNLMDGLRILGLSPEKFNNLKTWDDMIDFMMDSPLMDVKYFEPKEMNQSDRKSTKRPVIKYVVEKIRKSNKTATIDDEDYFFKKLFPKRYDFIEKKKLEIEEKTYKPSKYNGDWIIKTFNLKPGIQIGKILKHLSDMFGTKLDFTDEQIIKNEIKNYLEKQK